jgi:hypothetical protein
MRYFPPRPGVHADCFLAPNTTDPAEVLELVELSREGVHLRLVAAPVPGSTVLVRLSVPEGTSQVVAGEVAWIVADRGGPSYFAGVRFTQALQESGLRLFAEAPAEPQ